MRKKNIETGAQSRRWQDLKTVLELSPPLKVHMRDRASITEGSQSAVAVEPSVKADRPSLVGAAGGLPPNNTNSADARRPQDDSASSKLKIVIADDEPLVGLTLKEILEDEGFEVTTVADGIAALDAARATRPDILLTDVMMPKMNGIEVAKAINRFLPHCRVILLSGHAATGDLLKHAHDEGHDFEIVTKPIQPHMLLALLRRKQM
jgi:CheY-like chemotaxis protein